ncbi:MAG TPA: hypothetical protein VKG26_12865 [Bacteroidia bacterium]|nr:hypothetical protein [Bacteroidia bacterium]
MKQQLKKLAYERALEKYGEISDYHKYRIVSELRRINELSIEDEILCLERLVSIARQMNVSLEIEQEPVISSFVCYLFGITLIDPIEAKLVFTLPESLGEIKTTHSMEAVQIIYKEFTAEDEMLFFGELIKHKPKDEPTENR